MVRRTKEEAQETRAQIIEAAEKAFYKRGVARTTLADIAELAGVTRGAIYWHFNNKAELVQALLDSLHETHDHLARASESEDELDPLGCIRTLLLQVLNDLVLDARTRRINEILHHKCEFTDDMCEIRQQRQGAVLDCHEGIALAMANAVRRAPWAVARGSGCATCRCCVVRLCRWPDRALAVAAGQLRPAARCGALGRHRVGYAALEPFLAQMTLCE